MTKEIASVLKSRLSGLPFLDTLAGLAQPVIDVKMRDDDNFKIVKKMPVSYDVAGPKNTFLGMERQLVPDQSRKSILYFEDFGTVPDTSGRAGARSLSFISTLRVVCWINKTKLVNYKYNELTAVCMAEIINRLVIGTAINMNGIARLMVSVGRIPIQDAAIFSRYNYDEAELQYLRPPFEYFAIDLNCKYQVVRGCLPNINLSA